MWIVAYASGNWQVLIFLLISYLSFSEELLAKAEQMVG
jgi:hypothetical protein